jgi:uncharacterized RDD family membrane protein YckC
MNRNPYSPPDAPVADATSQFEYAGFWLRVAASLVDSTLILVITMPLLIAIYGWAYFSPEKTGIVAGPAEFFISYIAPAVATVLFWKFRQATPGKMILSLKVVDARTGNTLSVGQSVGRYFAYILSALPLGFGFIWVAFDARKQAWHDKLAGSVVIHKTSSPRDPVTFEQD